MSSLAARFRAAVDGWMRRRARQGPPPIQLRYRRIYILPTGNGWLFAVLLLAMWLGAVNYSNSMIFILVFLLAGIAVVSILHTSRNLVNIRIDLARVEPVFAGQPAVFPIQLHNPTRSTRLSIGLRADGSAQGFADLPPGGGDTVAMSVPTHRRGRLELGRFDAFTVYPLGVFIAWSPVWMNAGCVVYPQPETGRVPPPSGGRGEGTGQLQGEGSDDFAGLRRYRAGDPVRHIAWKSGHARELQTKQFAGEATSRRWLDFEHTGVAGLEARLSRLCRWIVDADAEGQVYGLRLPGVEIAPAQGQVHARRCLEALALFGS